MLLLHFKIQHATTPFRATKRLNTKHIPKNFECLEDDDKLIDVKLEQKKRREAKNTKTKKRKRNKKKSTKTKTKNKRGRSLASRY